MSHLKPTALKELTGNPGKGPLNKNEPKPVQGRPDPPGDLQGEALAEWGRIVPELERMGLLALIDRAYLVAYVEAWMAFDEARKELRDGGILVRGRDGLKVKNPAAQVMRDAADLMLKFGSRFGLSPADRARLSVAPSDDGEDAQVLKLLS